LVADVLAWLVLALRLKYLFLADVTHVGIALVTLVLTPVLTLKLALAFMPALTPVLMLMLAPALMLTLMSGHVSFVMHVDVHNVPAV
jgi:uncharacterized membrane protein